MSRNRNHDKNEKPVNKTLLWIIMILAFCGIAAAAVVLVLNGIEARDNRLAAEELNQQIISAPAVSPTPAQDTKPTEMESSVPTVEPIVNEEPEEWWNEYAMTPDKTIDFDELKQINPDVIAWISVPGTDIEYPVLYADNRDGFYLNHDIEGNSSKYGSIFTDFYNAKDFSGRLTVIYGHNMKNGSMFAQLHRFEDAQFFDEYDSFRIYTPEYMFEYEIIAARETGDENVLAVKDLNDDEQYLAFQNEIFESRDMNANFRESKLTVEDRIISLATCVSGDDYARYQVFGRLKKNAQA